MRGGIFQTRSLTARPQEPGAERAEPRLLPPHLPRPFPRAVTANPGILSATRDDEPKPANSAAILAPARRPVAAVRHPATSLLFVALAGFVLVALAGFWWFAAPARKTVAATESSAPASAQAVLLPKPKSSEAPRPPPTTVAAIPVGPDKKPPAAGGAAPKPQTEVAQPSPPVPAKPASHHVASLPASPSGADVAAEAPSLAKSRAQDHHLISPPTGTHRAARIRTAPPQAHLRPSRDHRPPEAQFRATQPPPVRQSEQAASFDRLLNQLTDPTKPGDQSLTPPAAGAEDPFAQRALDK
jgi:hypothetical protein